MRRLTRLIIPMALLGFAFAPAASWANFIIDTNPGGDKFFIGASHSGVASFTGNVGSQGSGPLVTVGTISSVSTGAGYANISPFGGILTSVTFTPGTSNLDSFNFRGQLAVAGSIRLTVQDNQGHAPQTFTFSNIKANQDFDRIGIISTDETIKFVKITTTSFKEVKQVNFEVDAPGDVQPPAQSPEPTSLVLLALCGIGVAGCSVISRKRRSA